MSTTTRPAYDLVIKSQFGFNISCLERAEKQMKVLDEMFVALRSMKRNIECPVAYVAVERMNEIFDEDFGDVLEKFANELEALQDKANHFEKLEDEAWQIQSEK
jgi:hypothetical protein